MTLQTTWKHEPWNRKPGKPDQPTSGPLKHNWCHKANWWQKAATRQYQIHFPAEPFRCPPPEGHTRSQHTHSSPEKKKPAANELSAHQDQKNTTLALKESMILPHLTTGCQKKQTQRFLKRIPNRRGHHKPGGQKKRKNSVKGAGRLMRHMNRPEVKVCEKACEIEPGARKLNPEEPKEEAGNAAASRAPGIHTQRL